MKVHLRDGVQLQLPFAPYACTGYVATKIEIESIDIDSMLNMLKKDPETLRASLEQLKGRFEINRNYGWY